jgi:hypothetical protein
MGRQLTDQEELQIQQYVTETNQAMEASQQKIASLEEENTQLKEAAATSQKEASGFQFDQALVASTLDKIAAAGLTTQDALPALKQEIQSNPSAVLGYLGKFAELVTRPAQPMGHVEKVASDNTGHQEYRHAESDAAWDNLMNKIQ